MSALEPAAGVRSRWAALHQRWRSLAPRERRGLALAFALIGLAVLWLVAVRPAWRTITSAPDELARLEAQSQLMQRQAADAAGLRSAPGIDAASAARALQAATERLGTTARLSLQGDRAVLTLTQAEGSALRQWLAEARSGARARPIEASLTRAATGFSGTLVVSLGGRP